MNCKYLHSGIKSSGWLRYCHVLNIIVQNILMTTKSPFTLHPIFGTARIKQAPVAFLSALGLPIYTIQVQIKLARVSIRTKK